MGEVLETSPLKPKKTIEEVFNDACPYFMAIGVSYDDFWYNEPDIAKQMLKAHEIRRKIDNEKLWLQGYYTYIALCSVSPVLHAFAKKGTKPAPYLSEPLALSQDEIDERDEARRQKRLLTLKEILEKKSKKREG